MASAQSWLLAFRPPITLLLPPPPSLGRRRTLLLGADELRANCGLRARGVARRPRPTRLGSARLGSARLCSARLCLLARARAPSSGQRRARVASRLAQSIKMLTRRLGQPSRARRRGVAANQTGARARSSGRTPSISVPNAPCRRGARSLTWRAPAPRVQAVSQWLSLILSLDSLERTSCFWRTSGRRQLD